jgi:hypothetical protein
VKHSLLRNEELRSLYLSYISYAIVDTLRWVCRKAEQAKGKYHISRNSECAGVNDFIAAFASLGLRRVRSRADIGF